MMVLVIVVEVYYRCFLLGKEIEGGDNADSDSAAPIAAG